jgi:hypothetical protein
VCGEYTSSDHIGQLTTVSSRHFLANGRARIGETLSVNLEDLAEPRVIEALVVLRQPGPIEGRIPFCHEFHEVAEYLVQRLMSQVAG